MNKKDKRQIILVQFIAAFFAWYALSASNSPIEILVFLGVNLITLSYLLFSWLSKKRVSLIVFFIILWCSIGLGLIGNSLSQNRKNEIIEKQRKQQEDLNRIIRDFEEVELPKRIEPSDLPLHKK